VPVVEKGELVGCLMEKEIAHLLEDDVTEDAQRQGRRCRWKSPIWKPARGRCGKNVRYGCCCSLSPKPIPAACYSILRALESAIALAFFIPLLIGTGGNSGTQITSTLVRSMALGEVRLRDMGRVIRKEVSTSLLIAITLGLAGCLRAWMMGIGMEITLIVSLTLVCITLWSAVVSSVIPLTLKRVGIDPAVVSAPFIATLIDGTGLIIYFKIAQYFLG
jgi:magnesium transporter